MLFDQIESPAGHVLALVHIPKTAGTSVRVFLRSLFAPEQCIEFYNGDIKEIMAAAKQPIRFAAGHHISWGVQRYFQDPLLFVTILRHPVDRYVSLHNEIKSNPRNALYPYAADSDVDAFLDFLLNSNIPAARAQLNNLQCRLVCGEPDATRAARHVREHFYLACAIEQVDRFAAMIAGVYGNPKTELPRLNVRHTCADIAALSTRTRERILKTDGQDLELYFSVRRQFEDVSEHRQWPTAAGEKPPRSVSR